MVNTHVSARKEVERLIAEVSREREIINSLKASLESLEREAVEDDTEDDNGEGSENCEWKIRYDIQAKSNLQLEEEIQSLEVKVKKERTKLKQLKNGEIVEPDLEDKFKGAEGKKLIQKLTREKNNLTGLLKDYEWQLDKEAKSFHDLDEKREALMKDLGKCKKQSSAQGKSSKKTSAKAGKNRTSEFVQSKSKKAPKNSEPESLSPIRIS